MHNLLKRKYSDKQGCGCRMCQPQKHHYADQRTVQDVRADITMLEQLMELEEDQIRSRSLVTATLS